MLVGLSPFFLWAGKQKYSWCLLCTGQKKLHPFGKLLFVCTSVCVSSPWNDLSSAQKWQKFGPWNLEWSIASVTHTQAVVWRRKWQPPPVLLPGESHGQRCLAAYNPWGLKESDTTERLTHTHTHTHTLLLCPSTIWNVLSHCSFQDRGVNDVSYPVHLTSSVLKLCSWRS